MGKAENIKRAKRLKEAKRRREQDEMIATAQGPAGLLMQKRHTKFGFETTLNKGPVKYSDLLKEFVYPILLPNDSMIRVKMKLIVAAQAWNAAILREKDEKLFQQMRRDIISVTPGDRALEELFDAFVERKEEEFSSFKNIFADFEIGKLNGREFELSVATTPLDAINPKQVSKFWSEE